MFLLPALCLSAHAEVRLFNGTDQPLHVDVLHADNQVRDVVLPVGKTLSQVLGTPLKPNGTEMLVVRDAEGKELKRAPVETDSIYAINTYSRSVIFTYLGKFQNRRDNRSMLLMNATGKVLSYDFERADFTRKSGKSPTPRDAHAVGLFKIPNLGESGKSVRVTLSAPGIDAKPVEITVGVPTLVTVENGALKFQTP